MTWRVGFVIALAALAAACSIGPRRGDDAVDPAVYTRCADPEAAAAWQRAQAALADNDRAAALAELLVCTRRCPDLVRAHLAYQDLARAAGGAVEQAMVDFYVQAPERDSPVPAYLKARLAETSYAQCNALEALLARDSSFAWAHLSRARVTRRQGRLLPALDMYAAAIVNDPQLHEARRERAQVFAELGRDEEAAVDYRVYVASCPHDLQAMRDYVALLLYRLDRVEEANVLLDRLEAAWPGDLLVRMDRAAALWRARRPRESIDAYLAILADAPATARAALNIGLLYYELPQNDADRRRYWPRARAAFRLFLERSQPSDGHEQFERLLGVPYRMERIADVLGPAPEAPPRVEDLHWPG